MERVLRAVEQVPRGRVVSYGDLASLVGIANLTDALGPVNARPVVAAAERHVAEANLRHLQASQFPRFHSVCLPLDALR